MRWNKHQGLLVFLMFSLAIATAHADIYKWVDDQGKVHYSDAPPRGAASQKIEIPTAPPQGENAQEQLKAFLEEQKKQEEARKEERVRKQEAQVVRQWEGERLNRCLAAQDQLDLMQFGRPVFRLRRNLARAGRASPQ